MTVSSVTNRKTFAGNGVTTSFATSPVVFFDTSDLVLTVVTDSTGASETLVENTDYTVTGGAGTTGTVSLAGGSSPYGAPAAGTTLVIRRVLPLTQDDDFLNNDINDAEVLEDALDRLVMVAQQLDEGNELGVRLSSDETATDALTVLPFDRASKFLAFNSSKELIAADAPSNSGSFLSAETGAVARTWNEKLDDIISLKDFGTAGNGTTDDTTGVTAADAIGKRVFIPTGIYDTTLAATALDGPYFGDGQIRDTNNNLRAPFFSAIKAAPSSFGTHSSLETAFNGDLSKVQWAMEHRITGAATLGQPTSGYTYTPEAYARYGWLYNTSGYNHSTSTNTGRTAACFERIQVYQNGQGDAVAYNVTAFVTGARAGATTFLANPAASMWNGDMTAGQDGVYLNPRELVLDDNGYDVAAIGDVVRLDRSNVTGALSAYWAGYRVQSSGAEQIDVAYSAIGKSRIGLDFSFLTLPSSGTWQQAAMTLKQNQRIYLNANGVDASGLSRFPSDPLDSYITYNSSLSAITAVVGGSASLQVYSDHVGLATGKYFSIGANQILGARDTGWTAFSGSASDKATAYDTATITLAQLAGRVRAIQIALTTHGIIGA